MRIALHQHAVLVGPGLGLVTVDHEVARPHVRGREAPFHAGRETRATAAEQARRFHLISHLLRRLAQRGAEALIAAGGEEALERVAVIVPEARRDDRLRVSDHAEGFESCSAGVSRSQTGCSPPSGGATPAAFSAAMCWRIKASVPCGGMSSRRPARRSSINSSNSAFVSLWK